MTIQINGSGTITGLSAGGISNTKAVASAAMPAGTVLQVQSVTKSDLFAHSNDTYTNVTGLTVNITPASTSNKILVQGVIHTSNEGNDMHKVRIARGGTGICVGDTLSSTISGLGQWYAYGNLATYSVVPNAVSFLDSPSSTSALTYSWQVRNQSGSNVVNVNEAAGGSLTGTQKFSAASTLIVMEIAG
jgi:hypothetical protein